LSAKEAAVHSAQINLSKHKKRTTNFFALLFRFKSTIPWRDEKKRLTEIHRLTKQEKRL